MQLRADTPAPARNEDGFSMVEVMLVLLLITILTAFAVWGMRDSKNAALARHLVDAAQTYDNAVYQFRQDHNGMTPTWGTTTWPAATKLLGPRPVMQNGPKAGYVKTPPDGVTGPTPRVILGTTGNNDQGGLMYRKIGTDGYELVAYKEGRIFCRLGPAVPDAERCH